MTVLPRSRSRRKVASSRALSRWCSPIDGYAPIWPYDDFGRRSATSEDTLQTIWLATLRGGWALNLTASLDHFSFDPAAYAQYRVDRTADTIPFAVPHGLYHLPALAFTGATPNRALTAAATIGYGATALFAEAAEGRRLSLQASAAWRPTPALRAELRWVHERFTR